MNSWQVTLDPHRCSIMHISNSNTVCAKYTIHGFPLNCVSGVKYFSASVSSMMSWRDHIDDICTKARNSLGFIRRNLRNCPNYLRNQTYTSLVRQILEHACCVWVPHQRKHIKQLESVQQTWSLNLGGTY